MLGQFRHEGDLRAVQTKNPRKVNAVWGTPERIIHERVQRVEYLREYLNIAKFVQSRNCLPWLGTDLGGGFAAARLV